MSNEDWKIVEDELSGVFGSVTLKIDNYEVTIQRSLVSENKLANMVYVNGKFLGKWLSDHCEERRRFLCQHRRCFTSAKTLKNYAKVFGKKSNLYNIAARVWTYYSPYWNSFSRMKSHFIKNNESIELCTPSQIHPGSSSHPSQEGI